MERLMLVLIMGLTAFPSRSAEAPSSLNGVWTCVELIEEGKAVSCQGDDEVGLTIWGTRYVISHPDGTLEMQIRIGSAGQIDLTPLVGGNRGKTFLGAHSTSGETLVISYAPIGAPRPPTVKPGDNPNGRTMTFKRVSQQRQAMSAETVKNSIGMTLRLVLPGTYLQGPGPLEPASANETQQRVTLTKPFYMGVHEVTVGQFSEFVKARQAEDPQWRTEAEQDRSPNGLPLGGQSTVGRGVNYWDPKATWMTPGFIQDRDHPVVFVSWHDALEFCRWLSRKEGKNYRLPTEAEWEFAARAGTTTAYWWGDSIAGGAGRGNFGDRSYAKAHPNREMKVAFRDGYIYTAPVGRFRPNPWGFHDMLGNVWEWVADYYEPKEAARAFVDPSGPQRGSERVAKGGGWANRPDEFRAATRFKDDPSFRFAGMGFRVLLGID